MPLALAVAEPNGVNDTLAEMDEFATTIMGDPWDMNQPTDLAFYRLESRMNNSAFANGVYSAQMTSGDGQERITLLSAGAPNHTALRIGKNGYTYPIDADHYRYLTFRMYRSNSNCNSGLIQWFSNDTYASSAMGVSNGFLVCSGSGWNTYVLDLKTIGIQLGSQNWNGNIRELIIHPFAGPGTAGATIKLDWARLTAANPNTARPYTIQWTGDGGGGPVTLYASLNNKALDANDVVIATGLSASGGSYPFQTGVLPAGSYYIAASNGSGTAWSAGPLTINAPPNVTIVKPSMTSGQEYAASEIGNAWDMSEATDLNYNLLPTEPTCVTNEVFSGGIYSAQVPQCPANEPYADPILYFGGMNRYSPGTPDPLIDTSKYRYLSYRFYQAGEQNLLTGGWVSRFGWWQVDGFDTSVIENPVMSRDIIILEGWNKYGIDLWASDVVDETYPPNTRSWQSSHPNRLRFDPNELAAALTPGTIQVDWIKLNAMDEVVQGASFPIGYAVQGTFPMTLTFYRDVDTNPSNGRTLIGSMRISSASQQGQAVTIADTQSAQIESPLDIVPRVYAPVILRNAVFCAGDCFLWNTSGVPKGTYFICINAQEAYDTTYRCSEAPIIVK